VEKVILSKDDSKSCVVVVPDSQLSLAIGNRGQNAKLAAKLTGFKIDIKSSSEYHLNDSKNLVEDTTILDESVNEELINI